MSVNRMVMVDIPGLSLDLETRAHLKRYKPGGIILFRKNIVDRVQTRALIEDLKSILGMICYWRLMPRAAVCGVPPIYPMRPAP